MNYDWHRAPYEAEMIESLRGHPKQTCESPLFPLLNLRNFWWQVSPVNKRSKPGNIQRSFPGFSYVSFSYVVHEEWNSSEFHTTDLHLTRGFCYCKQHDAVSFVDVLLIPHSQFTPGFHLINGVRHKGEILMG